MSESRECVRDVWRHAALIAAVQLCDLHRPPPDGHQRSILVLAKKLSPVGRAVNKRALTVKY